MKEENKKYRACAYLRLSREDEDKRGSMDESNSIKSQRMLIENFVRGLGDVELVKEVCDDGYSGTDYERPAFQEMIEMVERGEIDCVIVKDLSRLGRESIGAGNYIQNYFPKKNVRFIAVNDHYDSLTADGSDRYMIVPVKNFVNESYCRDISIKSRTNQQAKRMNGEYIGAFVCYGYKKDEQDKNRIVPDEEAAGVVREIFAWKIAGVSAASIAVRLNERGTLSPAEYKKSKGMKYRTGFKQGRTSKWTAKAVLRILGNEIYTGVLEQGKREKVSYKVKKTIHKPKSEWVRVENSHKAVVSKGDFAIVQELLKRDTRAEKEGTQTKLYAGLLYCGDCGMAMVSRTVPYKDKRTEYYICSGYNRNKSCSRHSIRVDKLNEIVLGEIKKHIKLLLDTEKLLSMLDTKKIRFEEAVERDKEILKLTGQAEEYETLKAALYTDLRDNLITREQFNRYREIYADRLEEIYRAKKVQEELVREIYEKGVAAGAWLERFKENMEITEPDRVLLVSLTDRILIYENKTVEIVFKYRNELQKAAQILSEAAAMQEKAVEMKDDEKVQKTDMAVQKTDMPVCDDVADEAESHTVKSDTAEDNTAADKAITEYAPDRREKLREVS